MVSKSGKGQNQRYTQLSVFLISHTTIVSSPKNTNLTNFSFFLVFSSFFCSGMKGLVEFCTFSRDVTDILIALLGLGWCLPGVFFLWAAFYDEGGKKIFGSCLCLATVFFIVSLGFSGYVIMRRCIERVSVEVDRVLSVLIRIHQGSIRLPDSRTDVDLEAQLEAVDVEPQLMDANPWNVGWRAKAKQIRAKIFI